MRRLGLKLWSTDLASASEARSLIDSGTYNYIELFSVPGSLESTLDSWRSPGTEFVIHAPHSLKGLNFASRDSEQRNTTLAEEAFAFADALDAASVIFHPGINGPVEETIRQMLLLRDPRTVVENKPMRGLQGEACVGWSQDQIAEIVRAVGCGFCLDFGHAVCAANAAQTDPLEVLKGFLRLRPLLYHLTDGLLDGCVDAHVRYGRGNYPLRSFISMVPEGARLTNEGARSAGAGLEEARDDAVFFRALEASL